MSKHIPSQERHGCQHFQTGSRNHECRAARLVAGGAGDVPGLTERATDRLRMNPPTDPQQAPRPRASPVGGSGMGGSLLVSVRGDAAACPGDGGPGIRPGARRSRDRGIYSAAWTATLSALRQRGAAMAERSFVPTCSRRSRVMRARRCADARASRQVRSRPRRSRSSPMGIYRLPEEIVIGSEARGVARDLLTSLPPRRRAVMFLRYGWGLSPKRSARSFRDCPRGRIARRSPRGSSS